MADGWQNMHVLPIDEMLIDQHLKPTARDTPIWIGGENQPLNLLAIQHVIADKGDEYREYPVR